MKIVWWEVFVAGIISWFLKKTLDYVWERGTRRVRSFEFTLPKRLWEFYQRIFLRFYLDFYFAEDSAYPWCNMPMYPEMAEGILRVHQKLHKENKLGLETCPYCRMIVKEKKFLQKFVFSPELYPPFKF